MNYRGNYPYPAIITPDVLEAIESDANHFRESRYVHFINRISPNEVIFTSRPQRGWMTYFVNFSYLVILTYGLLYMVSLLYHGKNGQVSRNYYRSRINFVLSLSLFATLIVMTSASVAFVYASVTSVWIRLFTSNVSLRKQ